MVQIIPQDSPLENIAKSLGVGIEGVVKQKQERSQLRALGESLGLPEEQLETFSRIRPTGAQLFMQRQRAIPDIGELSGLLEKAGLSPDEAERNARLYASLTAGGQTQLATTFVDRIQRNQDAAEPSSPDANIESFGYKFPEVTPFKGLTPKEAVDRQKDLYKDNVDFYKSTVDDVQKFSKEGRSLQQLERLNDTGRLPEGLGRLNINPKTGDIILPALASPEAQLFGKIVNDFTTQAKDSYGARVTNFELERFLKRLPTLANTREGRKVILDQMNIINELNQLHSDSLKEVYNHYKLQNIDFQDATQIAEQMRSEKEQELLKRYEGVVSNISGAAQDMVQVISPDGRIGRIPQNKVNEALKEGFTLR